MSWLALPASFEYLCYGSTTVLVISVSIVTLGTIQPEDSGAARNATELKH